MDGPGESFAATVGDNVYFKFPELLLLQKKNQRAKQTMLALNAGGAIKALPVRGIVPDRTQSPIIMRHQC